MGDQLPELRQRLDLDDLACSGGAPQPHLAALVDQNVPAVAAHRQLGLVERPAEGEVYVTFPSRAFGAGSERRFFDFLRSVEGDGAPVKALKQAIVDAYRQQAAAAA